MTRAEVADAIRAALATERARTETILGRHSRLAHVEGRTDLARMLDRLGDALTACGDDGAAPLALFCPSCCSAPGTTPQGSTVPPCLSCGGVLRATVSEDL